MEALLLKALEYRWPTHLRFTPAYQGDYVTVVCLSFCQNSKCLKTGPVVRLKGRIVNLKLLSVKHYIGTKGRKAGSVRKVKQKRR